MADKAMYAAGVAGAAVGVVAVAWVLLASAMAAEMHNQHAQREAECLREQTAQPHLESSGRYVDHEAAAVQAIARCPD